MDLRSFKIPLFLKLYQVEGQLPFNTLLACNLPTGHYSFSEGRTRRVLYRRLRSVNRAGLERAILAKSRPFIFLWREGDFPL